MLKENKTKPLMPAIILAVIFLLAYTLSKHFLFKSEINWIQAIISAIVIGVGYFIFELYLQSKKGV